MADRSPEGTVVVQLGKPVRPAVRASTRSPTTGVDQADPWRRREWTPAGIRALSRRVERSGWTAAGRCPRSPPTGPRSRPTCHGVETTRVAPGAGWHRTPPTAGTTAAGTPADPCPRRLGVRTGGHLGSPPLAARDGGDTRGRAGCSSGRRRPAAPVAEPASAGIGGRCPGRQRRSETGCARVTARHGHRAAFRGVPPARVRVPSGPP